MVGGVFGSTTVIVTDRGTETIPSVMLNVIVKTPVWLSSGVQVNVPLGEVLGMEVNPAPVGSWEMAIESDGVGTAESEPVTVKLTVVSSSTVSEAGAVSDIEPWIARKLKDTVVECTTPPLVPVIINKYVAGILLAQETVAVPLLPKLV